MKFASLALLTLSSAVRLESKGDSCMSRGDAHDLFSKIDTSEDG